MNRQTKLLVVLGVVAGVYLLTRSNVGGTLQEKIAKLIHGEEGERLTVYPDSGGKWTVGKGHLVLSTDRVTRHGRAVPLYPYGPRDPAKPDVATGERTITQDESDAFFERDTAIARNAVANKVSVPLTENQRAALVSLVFNIGVQGFAGSTLLRMLNAGNRTGAADQFLVWKWVTLPNGTREPRLLGRRERERSIFLS